MTRRLNIDQWRDHTQEPVIIWTYVGTWELEPVAVDDSNENDLYDEYARAFFAARAYYDENELEDEARYHDLTIEQAHELYSRGDGSAEAAGLPAEWYAQGCRDDGSDAIIYVDEQTMAESRRESLADAARYLDPEDVAEIMREVYYTRHCEELEDVSIDGYVTINRLHIPA